MTLRRPSPTSPAASAAMRGNRRADTRPEVLLRSALHRRGYRYRKDFGVDIGRRRVRIDVVFPKRRLAVFVDGCFWHGCPDHCRLPRRNGAYWRLKISGNRKRDKATDRLLSARGWKVVRVWEHADATTVMTALREPPQ